ncbi:MAG TPA: alkaline phosphatase family protein [Pyrinomonadaceae bacterium]|nr:alkaline phosphatase family protein [Pyrinomonadaceae bacterium]
MSASSPDPKIKNVFVVMLENHSFDNVFAMSGIQGITVATCENCNLYAGKNYCVHAGAPWFMTTDPGHEFKDVLQQLCGVEEAKCYQGGAYPQVNNSGFASSYATSLSENTGTPQPDHICDIMACFDTQKRLPVIYQLAREFAICDNWFSSLPGPTWPNRFFVHGASSAGWTDSPHLMDEVSWETVRGFRYNNGSIFAALQCAGHQWRLYNDNHNRYSDDPSGPEYGGWISQVASLRGVSQLDVHSMDRFASDVQAKTAEGNPAYNYAYTFIEPNFGKSFFAKQPPYSGPTYKGGSSQHPEDDPSGGEGLIKAVYEAIRNSPIWNSSLLVIVYDEHGGFYDSVKPGSAVPPGDGIPEGQKTRNASGFDFCQYGVRVPAVIVSPFIPQGTVDHTVYDHTSIAATLERLHGLNPLTQRDANANDLRSLLMSSTPRDDCPSTLASPAPALPHRGVIEKELTAGIAALDHLLDEVVDTVETLADRVLGDVRTIPDEPLPISGNVIGFLHILLKTELECSQLNGEDETAQARIVEDFKKIDTKNKAHAYVKHMRDKIEATQKSAQ